MDTSSEYTLITIILDFGLASKAVKLAKKAGASGGTIVLGRGTIKSSLLSILGLNETRKEILFIGVEKEKEEQVHEQLRERLELDRPNHGIMFTLPIKKAIGRKFEGFKMRTDKEGDGKMKYEAIFTIVNKGMSNIVIESANKAGSRGGTVIHGRGSGQEVTEKLFNLEIEPEKDIVLILSREEDTDNIVEAIISASGIEEEGNGILFILDVSKAIGLYKGD